MAVSKNGWTPLYKALDKWHEAVAWLLIHRARADVLAANNDATGGPRCTWPRTAGARQWFGCSSTGKTSAVGNDRLIPLHLASTRWNDSVVRLLIYRGADVLAADKGGDPVAPSVA